MLVIQYGAPKTLWPHSTTIQAIWLVIGYGLVQWVIARVFLAVRQRSKSHKNRDDALAATLTPLILIRFVPYIYPGFGWGFLGISYLTFRSLDVIFNIEDGLITDLPIAQYLGYLLFFPTISAGPIDRYRRFATDWSHHRTRTEFIQDLNGATQRIFRGLLYKFILAALIKRYWMDPVAHSAGLAPILSYMYAYSFYLFFDFAGYSAFAIGVSYLLGIHTPENFNRPFLARNIRDFWDRWHISLSWWFRDHIYMRFVLGATKGRWFRNKYAASYLGFFLTMGLMGVWHGTAWNYITYGLYHGVLLTGHNVFSRWNKQHQIFGNGWAWHIASVLITFNVVCFGLLIFSGRLG